MSSAILQRSDAEEKSADNAAHRLFFVRRENEDLAPRAFARVQWWRRGFTRTDGNFRRTWRL
jgi:hypothetical protein